MKRIILLLVALLFIAGCSSSNNEDIKGSTQVVKFDGGEATVTSGQDKFDWCNVGYSVNTTTSQGVSKNVIIGIETTGKYAGYCHGVFTMNSVSGVTMESNYYYDKDGKGYTVTEMNGQTYESEYRTK